jgi:hypothetical protein
VKTTGLRDFMQEPEPVSPSRRIDSALEALRQNQRAMTAEQKASLLALMPESAETFDVHQEITSQYTLIRAIRNELVDARGYLKQDFDSRTAKELITAVTSFTSLYLKSQEALDKDKQMLLIEQAFVETVKSMPPEDQDRFYAELERRMGKPA